MGIYFQAEANDKTTTFIVINPLHSFLQRLKDAQTRPGEQPAWRDIHRLALSCSTMPWREYTSYLETQMTQLVSPTFLGFNPEESLSEMNASRTKKSLLP